MEITVSAEFKTSMVTRVAVMVIRELITWEYSG